MSKLFGRLTWPALAGTHSELFSIGLSGENEGELAAQ